MDVSRIARISKGPGLRPGEVMYRIAYTVDGRPAGVSLARGDELEEWRKDLAKDGWTIKEEGDPDAGES